MNEKTEWSGKTRSTMNDGFVAGAVRKRCGGFMLLEALVALVVLAVVIVVIGQGLSTSIRAVTYSDGQTRAVLVAEGLIARIETGELSRLEDQEGYVEELEEEEVEALKGYRYQIVSKETDVENLQRVVVIITWGEGERERSFELEKLINVWPEGTAR
jgi:Tfp pilus assembly protein PilV